MARARNIKPGLFKNELLVEQSLFVRLLFVGLWTLADREGRLEDRPKRIKLELFPYDSENTDDALTVLAESRGCAGHVTGSTIKSTLTSREQRVEKESAEQVCCHENNAFVCCCGWRAAL